MENRYSIDGRVVPTINGGHGSGNFGHSGRPGKVGGSGAGGSTGKLSQDEITEIAEKQDWSVEDEGDTLRFGKYSSAGEDFSFLASKDNLADDIGSFARNFDAEEHAREWFENPGHGQPDDYDILLEDAKDIDNELWNLKTSIEEAQDKKDSKKNSFETNGAGKGNPYHDELGKFTTGPSTAFGEFKGDNNLVYGPQADYSGVSFKDKEEAPYRPFIGEIKDANDEFRSSMTKENVDATLQTIAAMRNVRGKAQKMESAKGGVYANDPIAIVDSIANELLGYAYSVGYRSSNNGKTPSVGEYDYAARNNKTLKEVQARIDQAKKIAKTNKELAPLVSAILSGISTMKYVEENTDFKGEPKVYQASKKSGLIEKKIK